MQGSIDSFLNNNKENNFNAQLGHDSYTSSNQPIVANQQI
jgi:hypothetical protein